MIDSENNNSPKKRFLSEIFSNLGEIKKPKKENTSYELNIMNEDNEIPKKKKSADSKQSKTLSKINSPQLPCVLFSPFKALVKLLASLLICWFNCCSISN